MTAGKQKNRSPEENLERSAPPRARLNHRIVLRDGDCHMLAKDHNVSTTNSVMAISVSTRGPNASITGIVA